MSLEEGFVPMSDHVLDYRMRRFGYYSNGFHRIVESIEYEDRTCEIADCIRSGRALGRVGSEIERASDNVSYVHTM